MLLDLMALKDTCIWWMSRKKETIHVLDSDKYYIVQRLTSMIGTVTEKYAIENVLLATMCEYGAL
jgi:hypothetical protein